MSVTWNWFLLSGQLFLLDNSQPARCDEFHCISFAHDSQPVREGLYGTLRPRVLKGCQLGACVGSTKAATKTAKGAV
ncbi:hypothetical protein C8R47DRAFT_1130962 [Mycena vitilis]|nr:hypothetical protein C8R47DRAFT_1130962 [Mycena vitilis]